MTPSLQRENAGVVAGVGLAASAAADSLPLLSRNGALNSGKTQEPMIANALLITIAILLAYGFWLMDQLRFMASYRAMLLHDYGSVIFIAAGVLFLNVFGAALLFQRKFFLKDTGRKLSHLDRQFHVGQIELPMTSEAGEEE